MHYLLFIPNEKRMSREVLDRPEFAGLLQTGEPDPLVALPEVVGPDNTNTGAIVLPFSDGDESKNPPLGYLPDRQTWKPIPGSECWLGWFNDSPPQAVDLARSFPLPYPGPEITLGDGKRWAVPSCFDQKHVMVPTADGDWTESASPRWPELYALAAPLMDQLESAMHAESEEIPFALDNAAASSFLSRLLCLNYRLTAGLIGALGLLDRDLLPRLLAAATDYTRLMKLAQELDQKKQEAPNS